MGICMSSGELSFASGGGAPAAILILMDGNYYKFSYPAKAEQILRESPGHFVCNSDDLYIGQNISELPPCQELQLGQIYFLLPRRKLQFVVSESDMASLLYKANSALKQSCTKSQVGGYIQPSVYTHQQRERSEEEELKMRSDQLYSSSLIGRNSSKSARSPFGSPRKHWTAKLDTIVEVA